MRVEASGGGLGVPREAARSGHDLDRLRGPNKLHDGHAPRQQGPQGLVVALALPLVVLVRVLVEDVEALAAATARNAGRSACDKGGWVCGGCTDNASLSCEKAEIRCDAGRVAPSCTVGWAGAGRLAHLRGRLRP